MESHCFRAQSHRTLAFEAPLSAYTLPVIGDWRAAWEPRIGAPTAQRNSRLVHTTLPCAGGGCCLR